MSDGTEGLGDIYYLLHHPQQPDHEVPNIVY